MNSSDHQIEEDCNGQKEKDAHYGKLVPDPEMFNEFLEHRVLPFRTELWFGSLSVRYRLLILYILFFIFVTAIIIVQKNISPFVLSIFPLLEKNNNVLGFQKSRLPLDNLCRIGAWGRKVSEQMFIPTMTTHSSRPAGFAAVLSGQQLVVVVVGIGAPRRRDACP
ncbi:hypothetical protein [Oceanidesulfovibrio marinus]|uniref:hypothetical protein n=1 Tax=Oceanidesulfovibrio marinus TaxID=370038 RepID=UPI00142EAA66|nr:hypothetical protein [Oceanidesulfovibrio marinus]